MATTQDITQGIKVIKINKTDLEGNNNTLSLQELETLRLKLDGLGVVEFKIISISEAVDYYTLFVEPNDIFESKVVGSFLNLNSTVESTPVNGIFTLTPGAAVTFDGYAIGSTVESSIDSTTGQIAPYFPATCTVQVDYIVSQSSAGDQNPLIPYISGSFGKVFGEDINFEGVSTFETHSRYFTVNPSLTAIPTDTNKDLAIETFTPALSASSANSIVYALSTQTKVYISQSEFAIDNNIIPDATLDTKDDDTRTLAAGVSRNISTWDVGQYYDFPGVNTLGPLFVDCSFEAATDGSGGIGGNGILKIDLVSSERGIIATTSSLQGSSMPPLSYLTTTLSQSFYPVNHDEQFYIQVSNTATGVDDISYRSGSWEISQFISQNTEKTLNVFSPFTTEGNFSISDCNPLINNAVTDRVNEFYMDVDYSSNAIIAVNADTILSGSATRAKVQYSNYTSERVTRPRYDGSKVTSLKYNEFTPSGSVYDDGDNTNLIWGGDNSFGKEPVINIQTPLIVEYNRGGGAWPFIPTKNYTNTSNILIVGDDPSQVGYLYPSDDSYFLSLQRFATDINDPINPESLNIFQYTTNVSLQPSSSVYQVLDYGLPSLSDVNYVFQSISAGSSYTLNIDSAGDKEIEITSNSLKAADIYRGTFIENNNIPLFEGVESLPSASPRTTLKSEINSLLNNNRVFISLFNNEDVKVFISGSQTGTDLRTLTSFNSAPLPLEITGTYSDGLLLAEPSPVSFECGDDTNGAIIYVVNKNNSIIFNLEDNASVIKTPTDALGTGAITDKFSTNTVSQNLIQITRESGNNPTT